jgi:phthiocerol/phenolphthiocerol synthesis type-I polyketide synthase C
MHTRETNTDVALIGLACRLPGGVHTPAAFWELLVDRIDAITEVPPDRFNIDAYYDSRPGIPGRVMTRWGGFLDRIDQFDAAFFGISPREASLMDPQQRLLLELAWEALENGGQIPDQLVGSQTGVYIGLWLNDYEARLFEDPALIDFYMTTGSGRYSASGRLSYMFGFQGPSVTVDTACSSSLVAVHHAVQSLRSGECELALAGAANIILQPHITIAYSQSRMMAPDGRCKFGDARANGYVRSEGAALIVLKPLSRALADGDPIYAVIRGSAVNNDGRSSGFLTTPGGAGQEEVLRKAYQASGLSPGQVQYVEAHGTGTAAGDPVEIGALGAVLATDRPVDRPCLIGSVKTNIGHTESAAGLAGLIKVVLSMQHKLIPASLHVQELNPAIPWDTLPIKMQREPGPWPEHDGPAIGSVSAFGIAGTNAHVVLQEAPPRAIPHAEMPSAYVLPLSARSPEALQACAQAYRTYLSDESISLADVCYTASVRRTHHDYRIALIGHTREELLERLAEMARGEAQSAYTPDRMSRTAFVFPGQGAQWIGMGRQLLSESPVFRAAVERFDRVLRPFVDWSVIDQLQAADSHSRLDEIDVIQPVLCAISIALAEVWRAWGVMPDVVIGHSLGEVAAACVAGAIGWEDAARIITTRSRLMKRVSGRGAMAVVGLSVAQAQAANKDYADRLSVAVSNSPTSTVLSGDPAALEAVIATLQAQDIFCRRVKVDVAAHSPHMDALREELVTALRDVQPQSAAVSIYSTVTGQTIDGSVLDATYWGRNLREPVLFAAAVEQAIAAGVTTFIELSPHPILTQAIEQTARANLVVLPSLRREEDEQVALLTSLGDLYVAGYAVDWRKVYPQGQVVALPPYPWQRERFWFESSQASERRSTSKRLHPLTGAHVESSLQPGTHWWTTELHLDEFAYLADHLVRGAIVLPAASYIELMLSAVHEALGTKQPTLRQLSFQEALVLAEDRSPTIQVVIAPDKPGAVSFQLLSRNASTDWILNARGSIELGVSQPLAAMSLAVLKARCTQSMSAASHYQLMQARGLDYGSSFQGVQQVWRSEAEALAEVNLPPALQANANAYRIHPALLDAALQVLMATDATSAHDLFLPVSIEYFTVFDRPEAPVWAYAIGHERDNVLAGDVYLLAESGEIVMAAQGVRMQRMPRSEALHLDDLFYEVQWLPAASDQLNRITATGTWLVLSDANGVEQSLAAQLIGQGNHCVLISRGETYQQLAADHYQINPARAADWLHLFQDVASPCQGVVYLWSLDAREDVAAAAQQHSLSVLSLVQALASTNWPVSPRLWLVTAGTQEITPQDTTIAIGATPLWGLGGVIAREHPEFHCTRVDLSAAVPDVEVQTLSQELGSDEAADQIALRGAQRYTARLIKTTVEPQKTDSAPARHPIRPSDSFRAVITQPGILDSLELHTNSRHSPERGQVEIEVHATGLNFMNVMSAMGIYPGYQGGVGPLGIECAGVVVEVGAEVEKLHIGDRVMAIAFDSLGTHAVTDARLAVRLPDDLPFDQAASIPIAFVTTYYALHQLAHLSRGERVLVHAATGGVGLAAIQIARWLGAEVFATAGSEEKRAYLRSLGVQHVMDSRSLLFADEMMQVTNGQGVDVVLNSLSGEAIARSLSVLAPYGRFLEIGKRDIYQNTSIGLQPFQKSLSYFAIDLDRLSRERPALVGQLLREVMQQFEAGAFQPLPLRVYPVADIAEAFRTMAQARHMGKLVIDQKRIEGAQVSSAQPDRLIHADGTYLLTGGAGGLGLKIAQWLVEAGARHLVLVSRHNRSDLPPHVIKTIEELETRGTQIVIAQADVAREAELAAVFAQIDRTLPPLKGVIHAAGVLDDGVLLQQTTERFQAVLSPKVDGAWNLHRLTLNRALDFFVLFSSVASVLGTAGQGNYAAANAALDGLAHQRAALGLPALSINWGPWAEVGLAAQRDQTGLQSLHGIGPLSVELGLQAWARVLTSDKTQVTVMPFNVYAWCEAHVGDAARPFFAVLREAAAPPDASDRSGVPPTGIRQSLLAAEAGRPRRALLESYLREQAAQVLRLAPTRIEVHKPLQSLGFDSLMTLEFRNRLEAGLGLSLPATLVWNYPTINSLVPYLAEKLNLSLDDVLASPDAAPIAASASSADLDDLSAAEIEALLADELASADQLLKNTSAQR